jgi:hypothetical protein
MTLDFNFALFLIVLSDLFITAMELINRAVPTCASAYIIIRRLITNEVRLNSEQSVRWQIGTCFSSGYFALLLPDGGRCAVSVSQDRRHGVTTSDTTLGYTHTSLLLLLLCQQTKQVNVKWVPCHGHLVRPQVADEADGRKIRKVVVDNGWSPIPGNGKQLTTSNSRYKITTRKTMWLSPHPQGICSVNLDSYFIFKLFRIILPNTYGKLFISGAPNYFFYTTSA